jgi:hypothetical protein
MREVYWWKSSVNFQVVLTLGVEVQGEFIQRECWRWMTQAWKGAGAFNVLSSSMLLLNPVWSSSIPRNFDYRRFLNGRTRSKGAANAALFDDARADQFN